MQPEPVKPRGVVVRTADLPALAKRPPPPEPVGAGTELKKLLARLGVVVTPSCKCNARAREMDERGPAWCRANVGTIVDWLEEEHAARVAAGEAFPCRFTRRRAGVVVRAAILLGARAVSKIPTPGGGRG